MAVERSEKYLVIHLDGVSSEVLFQELQAGNLPFIEEIFEPERIIEYGVTLFPPETEMVILRIRWGLDQSDGVPGWGYLKREQDKTYGTIPIFSKMFLSVAPVSREHFLFSYPFSVHLAGLSLLNVDRLWETHDVLELYWFNTDWMAHSYGKESHLEALYRFDRYLGLAYQAGKFEGANIVIYSDHGMVLDDVISGDDHLALKEILGDKLRWFNHPHIYLTEPEEKYELAEKICLQTDIDVVFVQTAPGKVRGYTKNGDFEIIEEDDRYRYSILGYDFFGYTELGYTGEFLTKDQWLELTAEHLFPGVIPNLALIFRNPLSGDMIYNYLPPKIPYVSSCPLGNHTSLTSISMRVPVLYTGPALEDLPPIDRLWLHELFSKHFTMIDFAAPKHREKHNLSFGYPLQGELNVSPAYNWRVGFGFSEHSISPWLEYSLYHSYLTRLWLGVTYAEQKPAWQVRLEAFIGNCSMSVLKRQSQKMVLTLNQRLSDNFEFFLGTQGLGLRLVF